MAPPRSQTIAALAAASAALAAPSSAAAITDSVSQNWAGYAVTGKKFERVSGTWVVPKLSCTPGRKRYSGIWVGLGGFSATAQALEQVGTDQNCGSKGKRKYSAWWELVPDDPVKIGMKVGAGDKISGSVTVSGTSIRLHLKNRTRKTSFATTRHRSSPDVTSAEWILEAPGSCDETGSCDTLPLANFGTAPFGSAFATLKSGRAHSIGKGPWTINRLRLSDPAGGAAIPSGLKTQGTAFKVTYKDEARSQRLSAASHSPGRRPI